MTSPLPGKRSVEHTHWSLALICFYMSCAGVALGATFAGGGYMFFGSKGWLVFGIVMSAVSMVTCFLSLSAARKAPKQPSGSGPRQ